MIEILRGAETQRILSRDHGGLSVYGIGKHLGLQEWRDISRALLHQGLMTQSQDGFSVLSLNEARTRFRQYADQALARFVEQNPSKRFERVVAHLRFDAIAEEVAQLAADLEADLVVVGTHGRKGLSRLLLGSSAEATVRLAPCPVLVTRPKAVPEAPPQIEPPCPHCVAARRASGVVVVPEPPRWRAQPRRRRASDQ